MTGLVRSLLLCSEWSLWNEPGRSRQNGAAAQLHDQQRAEVLAEAARPGAVVAQVARRYGIAKSLLYDWRKRRRCAELATAEPLRIVPYGMAANIQSTERTQAQPYLPTCLSSSRLRALQRRIVGPAVAAGA